MTKFNQEFKVNAVEKALSRSHEKTLKNIANDLGIGHSTLQKWVRLAKANNLEKQSVTATEKSPQQWSNAERLQAILNCHPMSEEEINSYCRQHGIFAHHIQTWQKVFELDKPEEKPPLKNNHKQLTDQVKKLTKELDRKNRALSEAAALLVLSKKCQAIWEEREDD